MFLYIPLLSCFPGGGVRLRVRGGKGVGWGRTEEGEEDQEMKISGELKMCRYVG